MKRNSIFYRSRRSKHSSIFAYIGNTEILNRESYFYISLYISTYFVFPTKCLYVPPNKVTELKLTQDFPFTFHVETSETQLTGAPESENPGFLRVIGSGNYQSYEIKNVPVSANEVEKINI